MPPKTRAVKTIKCSKENVVTVQKNKAKVTSKVTKPARKVLADKTNSASDDNTSVEAPKKGPAKRVVAAEVLVSKKENKADRPRRDRRLPNRFAENEVLNILSNDDENTSKTLSKTKTPVKQSKPAVLPFKIPQNDMDSSLVTLRSRRICRLPSRFEDHFISPNKLIPVQPVNASTPLAEKSTQNFINSSKTDKTITNITPMATVPNKPSILKVSTKKAVYKASADTNNNANQRILRTRSNNNKILSNKTGNTLNLTQTALQRPGKLHSFRLLEDNKTNEDKSNQDIYEFKFDPNEEPTPQKKKRKRVAKKKPNKPKTFFMSNNYEKNLLKSLTSLKNVVSKKNPNHHPKNAQPVAQQKTAQNDNKPSQLNVVSNSTANQDTPNVPPVNENISVRVEDIAADIEPTFDDHHEFNYSPVTSPKRIQPEEHNQNHSAENAASNTIPSPNFREQLSFFDEEPVASSSMNGSVRHPSASPWRVEFSNLPIKWNVTSYVKPNMTPAVECSFVYNEDSRKKHVYTNMVPQNSDPPPEIVEKDKPKDNLVQTSIISFYKEVAERNMNKKKRGRSATPVRVNSVFENTDSTVNNNVEHANKKRTLSTPQKDSEKDKVTPDNSVSDESYNFTTEKENVKGQKRKNNSDPNTGPAKTPKKHKDKKNTLFGFDDSEIDQENISPKKTGACKLRSLRSKGKKVLRELNEQAKPTRAQVPMAPKANAEVINEIYEVMKSADDAPPVFPDKNTDPVTTNTDQTLPDSLDDNSQSVHLFEDIELVHHSKLQPQRKSYGKAKKVTIREKPGSSLSDVEQEEEQDKAYDYEDDLADLSFNVAEDKKKIAKKKRTKKQKLSKKEKDAAEAWAAGFNSMCEDIDHFPLVVE